MSRVDLLNALTGWFSWFSYILVFSFYNFYLQRKLILKNGPKIRSGFFFPMNNRMIIVFGACHGWLGKMTVGWSKSSKLSSVSVGFCELQSWQGFSSMGWTVDFLDIYMLVVPNHVGHVFFSDDIDWLSMFNHVVKVVSTPSSSADNLFLLVMEDCMCMAVNSLL